MLSASFLLHQQTQAAVTRFPLRNTPADLLP